MKKNILNKALLGLMLAGAFGCRSKKEIVSPPVASMPPVAVKPAFSANEVIKNITSKQPAFTSLSIKSKAELIINNNGNDVSMNIRIQDGEIIWVSVTAIAGIEVGRAIITPDSIKVLNRLQSEYTKKPFSFIHQFTNKQVDFKTVQALFTANAFPGTLNANAVTDVKDGNAILNSNLAGLLCNLVFNQTNNLIKTSIIDQKSNQSLVVDYANFTNVGGKDFPQTVKINSVAANKSISINLKYNQITLNEDLEFPFNVPKRFTVKN